MGTIKKQFIVYGKQKLALTCGVCAFGNDQIGSLLTRCGKCLSGTKRGFVIDKKYQGKETFETEEEI